MWLILSIDLEIIIPEKSNQVSNLGRLEVRAHIPKYATTDYIAGNPSWTRRSSRENGNGLDYQDLH